MADHAQLVPLPDSPRPLSPQPKKQRRHRWSHVSTHASEDDALCALEADKELVYKFHQNYGSKGAAVVYVCVSHSECEHLLRVQRKGDDYIVSEAESHKETEAGESNTGENKTGESKTGVSLLVKKDVESYLLGAGPVKVDLLLRKKYKGNPALLALIPTVEQMKNLKAQMRKNMEGGWGITSAPVVHEWASDKTITARVEFFGAEPEPTMILFSQTVLLKLDELFVIKVFAHPTTIGGREIQSIGLIFSSRRVLCNAFHAHQDQGDDGLLGVTDGTYKIHFGGWTLVCFGTYCTRYIDHQYSKHFVPFTFMFVRTEHQSVYTELFRATRDFCQVIFGISLNFTFGSLDHAWPIANAFKSVWPDISLMTCWPHMKRKSGEQKSKLKDRSYYDSHVAVHLDWMEQARSAEQFSAFVKICIALWRKDGEDEYASWFEETYLLSPWDSWYMSRAGATLGILPSQNAIESFHHSIKECCIQTRRANTATVLNEALPSVLKFCGKDPETQFLGHFGEGAIPAGMFVKAKHIVDDNRNYMRMGLSSDASRTLAVVCNASAYAYSVKNRNGSKVTQGRVNRYLKSLQGDLAPGAAPTSIRLHYLSLHRVLVLTETHEPFQMATNWQRSEIMRVRSGYVCGCKSNRQTGWICSHVLATLHLTGAMSLDSALASLPIRLPPGGQIKVRDALSRDTNDAAFFSVPKLVRLFQDLPARNLHWNLLKPDDDGEIVGTIVKWIPGNGRYSWRVQFSDGSDEEYECEALAEAISYSHSVGLAIMGKLQ